MIAEVPLKWVVSYNDDSLPESTDDSTQIRYVEISDVNETDGITGATDVAFGEAPSRARRLLRRGDVIVSTVRTYLRAVAAVGTSYDGAICSTGFAVLRARGVDERFLKYAVLDRAFMDQVVAQSTGVSYPAINASDLVRIRIPLPARHEQRAIADYLDRETTQIDAFIAKNEELITLLTERRAAAAQSEVEHHVGLGSRLKFHFREIDVRAGSKWEELPLLSVSIHHGVVPRDDDSESSSEASDLSHYKIASPGDIVLNRMRAFQGGLGVAPCTGLVSPDYAVLRPAPDVDPNWLALVMRTPRFVSEMVLRLRGIGTTDSGAVRTPRISVADLGAILVSVPGSTLQAAELHAVATSTTQIEAALLVAKRSVALARERRAALISAAVTGRIDVADA